MPIISDHRIVCTVEPTDGPPETIKLDGIVSRPCRIKYTRSTHIARPAVMSTR